MYYHYTYQYPIGNITLACSECSIIGLWIEGQRFFRNIGNPSEEKEADIIKLAKTWLDRYFNCEKPKIEELPIELIGTPFRKAVWQLLTQIPYGEVVSYSELAKQIAKQNGTKTMSAQAIGSAVGRNPISIIVPCHRVVGVNGDLTGYAGGLDVKTALLTLEGVPLK